MFGTVVEKSCIFLIDTSGSMDQQMDELKKELIHLVWEQLHKHSVRSASVITIYCEVTVSVSVHLSMCLSHRHGMKCCSRQEVPQVWLASSGKWCLLSAKLQMLQLSLHTLALNMHFVWGAYRVARLPDGTL